MKFLRSSKRKQEREQKKQAEKEAAIKTRMIPADMLPNVVEVSEMIIQRKTQLNAELEYHKEQIRMISVALNEQVNSILLNANISPENKQVDWSPDGKALLATTVPTAQQEEPASQANAEAASDSPFTEEAPASTEVAAPATTAPEPVAVNVTELAELEQKIQSN